MSSSCSCFRCVSRSVSALLAPLELDELALDVRLEPDDALLDLRDLDAPVLDLALDLGPEPHRLLPHLDLRLAPARLDLALDVARAAACASSSAARTRDELDVRSHDGREQHLPPRALRALPRA